MMRSAARDVIEPPQNDDANFKTPAPLPQWDDGKPFDVSLNCLGVVHVRLIAAQRLPCPVGSSVCCSVSLPPWRGRVRTQRTEAFLSSFDHGVCVSWDRTSNEGVCSMVNAWNSEESPVPDIKVDLMFSPLGIGLLDFTMSTVVLPCQVLMKSPLRWRRQWCQAEMSESKSGAGADSSGLDSVSIHLEAMFAPGPAKPDSPPPLSLEFSSNRATKVPEEDVQKQGNDEDREIGEAPKDTAIRDSNEPEPFDQMTASVTRESVVPHLTSDKHDPHLLRLVSFWVPSSCGVCSTVLFGRNKGFQCEECSIECCRDCRLHVDLQIPCGSDAARIAAEKSEHGKMSIANILSVVAPDEAFERNKDSNMEMKSVLSEKESIEATSGGIGSIKLKFIRAVIFEKTLASDTDPDVVFAENTKGRLCRGDYYARVSISSSNKTGRTPTIQNTGMPIFGSVEMRFIVDDYGREFRLDVVDANTDKPVGTTVLTTQGMLQNQRDLVIQQEGVSLLQLFRGPVQCKGERMMKLELRKGVKNGFGATFFDAPKIDSENQQVPSGIIGWLEVEAGLEEYVQKLYKTGFECPPRLPQELNMVNFQEQLNRVKSLVDDIKSLVDDARYITSWESPLVTTFALYIFVTICLRFDSEYCGSLPLLFLLSWMLYLSSTRRKGARKISFIRKEIAARRKAEEGKVTYLLHRPIGTIGVNVTCGSALLSRDGIPGKTSCHIIWDPLRYAKKKAKAAISKIDKASEALHEMGFTNTRYAADPEWELHESLENKRLNHLLPVEDNFFVPPDSTVPEGLSFPILQPFSLGNERKDVEGRFVNASLTSWDSSPGAVVFQVRLSDLLFGLGFDYVLGEVVIPFSKLVKKGRISGWFEISNEAEIESFLPYEEESGENFPAQSPDAATTENNKTHPRLFLSLQWRPPFDQEKPPDETEQELSIAIQEEFVRSSKQKKFDLVGSSLGAMNTALGIGGNLQDIQNSLSSVLDLTESTLNLFNFADPFKSSCLFCLIAAIWVLFILVPSRFIILSAGLVHFLVTCDQQYGIVKKFMAQDATEHKESSALSLDVDSEDQDQKEGTVAIWIMNALRSLPTSEDLRKTYFWESFRIGYKESEKHMSQKRKSRLKQLWKAQWFSQMRLRVRDETEQASIWRTAFGVVQGHHFLWWKSVRDFDNGEVPAGRVFLSGHAGLTGPSPIEMRELSKKELSLFVGIFGRGLSDQERLSLVTPDATLKESLENAILSASAKDD